MNFKIIVDKVVKAMANRGERLRLRGMRQAEEYIKTVLQGLRPSK
jgi:hypothetical protein